MVEKAKDFGDKIHMDVAGKFQRPARGTSYNYELAFVDSATGYIKLYPMTSCAQQSQQNICNGLLIDVKRCKQNLMSLVTQRW